MSAGSESTGGESPQGAVPHMTPEEFRRIGRDVVDFIADYMERAEALPVTSETKPGELFASLPKHAPETGQGEGAWDGILADLSALILPALTHWQSPRFFGYFPCNASGPAILGELVSAGLNVNGMNWATGPAVTELEMRMMDWIGEAIGLPEPFLFGSAGHGAEGGGVIQGTASEATLIAILAGRRRVLAGADDADLSERCVVYASDQAHSSVMKGAMIAGLAEDASDLRRVRFIRSGDGTADAELAMDARALSAAMERDLADGLLPCCVVATVGTTSTGAIDRIPEIADVVTDVGGAHAGGGCWLHVDAAHAGSACVCPEHRWVITGVERADSMNFNPHKSLLVNFDCSLMWTQDRRSLTSALSIDPEYLRDPVRDDRGQVRAINYRDWQVPLGRRMRALKVWFVLRHYGLEGLRAYIREQVRLGALFESWVRADERFEIAAPRHLQLVCFRLRGQNGSGHEGGGEGENEMNRRLLSRINAGGRVFLSHAAIPDRALDGAGDERFVLRFAVGASSCREAHVREAWRVIQTCADEVSAESGRS
jgi:aromatic-L-amino-acid decarboxylase